MIRMFHLTLAGLDRKMRALAKSPAAAAQVPRPQSPQ
jgi:hypothetical protein